MATIKHKNFAQTTLGAAIETTDGTSITVTSEASFPAVDFIISIDTEVMLVTNVSTTTWTVTRGYEGSTAATHLNGAAIYHDISAAEADVISSITAAGLALIDDADAAAQLVTLGFDIANVKNYGAVGDNTTDDTAAIQAAIDAVPAYGLVDGGGDTYLVTALTLKSNMRFENFHLKTKAGATDLVAPVTIGSNATDAVTSNVIVRNVHVDGNRINQTDIGSAEDGGRSGFRIVGHVTNLLVDACSATYCATDGIEIYSGLGGGSFPRAINITVQNSRFNWNRRHGGSGDAINAAHFINCEFNDNGQDLNGVDPLDDGGRGANNTGVLCGNGFTLEGYGVGSTCTNVSFIRVLALRNALGGILCYDAVGADDVGFLINDDIVITGSNVDAGTEDGLYAIEFTSTTEHKALGAIYSNINLSDNLIQGKLSFRCVDKVTINGGTIITTTDLGNLDYATLVKVGNVNCGGLVFALADSTVSYFVTGPVSATDNALVRFNGAGGNLLQDSAVTVDDNGNLNVERVAGTIETSIGSAGGNRLRLQWDNNNGYCLIDSQGGAWPLRLGVNGTARLILDATGNVIVDRGLHVGGTSDPGDNNAIIDGTLTIGATLISAAGLALIDDANAAAQLVTLGAAAQSLVDATILGVF